MKKLFLTLFTAVVCLTACGPKTTYKYPFQDPSLKMEKRIENLLTLLTPEEKIGLLMNKSISVDSLGIPAYNWWSEACHGIRADGYTVYPQPIGMAAAFDPDQVYKIYSGTIPATRNCPSGARTSIFSATRAGDAARRPRARTRT